MKRAAFFLSMALVFLGGAFPAHSALSDYFVSTAWLENNRNSVKIVDVRVAPLYFLGHVDKALHIDKGEFLSTRGGVKSLIPTAAELEALMDRYGIAPGTTVVAYAEDNNPYAARFVWTLRQHGHSKSYVLDGGYEKWSKEKRPTALLPTQVKATGGYRVRKANDIKAEADYVLARLGSPSAVVWDTRSKGEYDGTDVRADRGGHIPGARHLDWVNLQKEVGGVKVLKSEKEIRALLAAGGITPDREILAHCQTGIRSSYATLVLLGLGYRVRNYDGSWTEWGNNASLPVEGPVRTVFSGN